MSSQDLMSYDDIYVKSNDLTQVDGPTVIALAHNEMYFLPTWLDHYRKLGAERFIILDDASTDSTLDYLRAQPDVMVVGSHRRYGETVPVIDRLDPTGQTVEMRRMVHLWRMILLEKFTLNRWVVQADLDEFLTIPEGRTLASIFEEFAASDYDAITSTMLDIYPASIEALRAQMTQPAANLADDWFFDALPHRLPEASHFREVYHGSRARLFYHFLPRTAMPPHKRLRERLRFLYRREGAYRHVNSTQKFTLVRWRPGTWMQSSHRISLPASSTHHLPILHMKFTGDLYRRAQVALRDKSYYNGSKGYVQLVELLSEMERRGASFLFPKSTPIRNVAAFHNAGLILGFDHNTADPRRNTRHEVQSDTLVKT